VARTRDLSSACTTAVQFRVGVVRVMPSRQPSMAEPAYRHLGEDVPQAPAVAIGAIRRRRPYLRKLKPATERNHDRRTESIGPWPVAYATAK
jgi:hypothetical protein